jgi:hypothetical protein
MGGRLRPEWHRNIGAMRTTSDAPAVADAALTHALREAILALLSRRAPGKTICPSEVARHVASTNPPQIPPQLQPHLQPQISASHNAWRALMPVVRDVARAMAAAGEIDITQQGIALNPALPWKGAIRLRLRERTCDKT